MRTFLGVGRLPAKLRKAPEKLIDPKQVENAALGVVRDALSK
jgi:hypothetical protein